MVRIDHLVCDAQHNARSHLYETPQIPTLTRSRSDPQLHTQTQMAPFETPPRGLAHARRVRDDARTHHKIRLRIEAEGVGHARRRVVEPEVRYRRRLAQNQRCAEASRLSNAAYLAELERQTERSPADLEQAKAQLQIVEQQRALAIQELAHSKNNAAALAQKVEQLRAYVRNLQQQSTS